MELKPENRLILASAKIYPSSLDLEQINQLIPQLRDWEYFITTIINRSTGPLLYNKLPLLTNSALIPVNIRTKLQQVYYKTLTRSTILHEHFRKIGAAFTQQGVSVIALKGIYLSEFLYRDIGLRQFSDIDLLVKEEDGLKCLDILTELGYKPADINETDFVKAQREIVHYAPMVLDGVSIEIHIKLHRNKEKYHLDIHNLWKNAIPVSINGTNVYALNTTDLLIHLCVHLDKHVKEGHVQFTCFNDITNVLEKYSNHINWDEFNSNCQNYNCRDIVFKYLVLVHKYMNATVPLEITNKYAYLLTHEDENHFIKHLEGNSKVVIGNHVSTHIGNLNRLKTLTEKLHYCWDIIFPPKAFMIQKYFVSHDKKFSKFQNFKLKLWWMGYPYRWWVGLKGVVRVIIDKVGRGKVEECGKCKE